MQIDVSKERRNDTATVSTTVGFVIFPILPNILPLKIWQNQLYQPGILEFTMNQVSQRTLLVDIGQSTLMSPSTNQRIPLNSIFKDFSAVWQLLLGLNP